MLVDASGKGIGTMDKMAAHLAGRLHRAFSVFIFNSKGQLLLQQRALDKYHSGGEWTNTCCSHPRLGEPVLDAANRRLQEEMGMRSELTELFQFTYEHPFDNGLTEHEYDHVFIGMSDEAPIPNPAEVAATRYVDVEELTNDMATHPDNYTAWLKICFDKVKQHYYQHAH